MNTDIIHKEIDLIQNVISRMSSNSFHLKGWLISIIAVVLALSKDSIIIGDLKYFSLTLCLPVLSFWYLDSFFLHKEKCFRKLYDWVVQNRSTTDEFKYSLNYKRFNHEVDGIIRTMFSKTLFPFYGLTIIILISITIINMAD